MVRRTWNKQRVIDAIRKRRQRGLLMQTAWGDDRTLVAAAIRYFGRWHKALVAAGVATPGEKFRRRCKWTKQNVIEALRDRQRQGLGVRSVWRDDTALYSTAKRLFGSWRRVVLAAGLEPHQKKWTSRQVLAAIRDRHRQGHSVGDVWRDDDSLHGAGKRYFGSWPEALRAAGLTPKTRRSWNKRRVVEAMRHWHDLGLPMTDVWKTDKGLFTAACRRFGNWQNALHSAGLESKPRKRWSKQRVIKELRAWYRHRRTSVRMLDPSLVGAAVRLFDSLDDALEKADLEPRYGRWSPRRVVEELQNLHVRGVSLEDSKGRDRILSLAVNRFFGSWREAMRCAGVIDGGRAK